MTRTSPLTLPTSLLGQLHRSFGAALLCQGRLGGLGCNWAYQWAEQLSSGMYRKSISQLISMFIGMHTNERIFGILPEAVNLDKPSQRGRYRFSLLPT